MPPIDPQAFIDLLPAVRQSPGHSMQCAYDEPADVVYVAFKPEAETTDSELGPGDIVVRYRGDEVIGLTILHASRRIRGEKT
ncbi:MAG: DUF2283 domain-containing protein [Planctomycetota bacterium]